MKKIAKIIWDTIESHKSLMGDTFVEVKFKVQLITQFAYATQDQANTIILMSPSKSCDIYPLPTSPLKQVLEYLHLLTTAIIYKSLAESNVSLCF